MKKVLVPVIALLMAAAGSAQAEDVKSGLQVGEFPEAFIVRDVTGPAKGKSLCYRCRFGGQPVVTIFTREINADVAALVKQVDNAVTENESKKLKAFVVLLTDDPDADEKKLETLAKEQQIKNVPLTIFDGIAGPPQYKVAENAGLTVLMWNKMDVKANHSFGTGKFQKKDVEAVVKDTSKILN